MLFATFAFIEGISNVIGAIKGGRVGEPRWGTLLLEGLLSIAVAVLIVMSPARMSIALIWTLGFWALLTGALRIGAAIRLRKIIAHEWVLALAGVFAIAFGLVVLFRPVAGALAMLWWLASYEIVFGIMLMVVGFRLRHVAQIQEGGGRQLPTEGLHQAG
jgi:uncharacterized membrane protein HdeD (DUF308 family)